MKQNKLVPISRNGSEPKSTIWNTLAQVYREFSTESTVHGIKYTTQAKTAIERLLWLTVVIISVISAGQLANKFYERHESGNMRTTVVTNQYPSLKLALPAMTLCHGNLVSVERMSLYLKSQRRLYIPRDLSLSDFEMGLRYLRELIYPTNQYSEPLNKLQRILDANHMSISELLEQISPSCTDQLITCMYEGQRRPCDELLVPTLTSHGICCSFNNAVPKFVQTYRNSSASRDLYSVNFGPRYILSILLKPYDLNDYIASTTFGDGYKVIVHERYTLPGPNALEFMVSAGHETIIGLYGTYLTSSPEVLNLPLSQRGCKTGRNGERYRAENCYMECRNLATLRHCDCVPFYADDDEGLVPRCNLTHIPCLSNIISEIYSLTLRDPQCNCLPDCEGTKYIASITGEPFDAAKFKPGRFFETAQKYPNSTAVHLTFASQAAVLERRELVLSWINLVSSLGGVFSLFLGCSFISVIEFFYFFLYQLVWKLQFKFKNSSTVINSR